MPGCNSRPEDASRIGGAAGKRAGHQDSDTQRQPDSEAADLGGSAIDRGAEHGGYEEEGDKGFYEYAGEERYIGTENRRAEMYWLHTSFG